MPTPPCFFHAKRRYRYSPAFSGFSTILKLQPGEARTVLLQWRNPHGLDAGEHVTILARDGPRLGAAVVDEQREERLNTFIE